jgi:biopolymer transport protein ExbD
MKFGGRQMGDDPDINLISLIDVLFCLILFLVVTTSFTNRAVMKLQLPTAEASAQAEPGTPLTLLVDSEGKYFIGNNEVLKSDVASLKEAIQRSAGDDRSQPVILRADGRAPHQAVITAMDALGQSGFVKISIATAPPARP